jgi:hypothetical protein
MAATFTATTVANPIGAQGTYPQREGVGHEGMIADLQAYVTRSYRNQSGAAIPFGVPCMTDNSPTSNDAYAIEPATGATGIVGLTIDTLTGEGVSTLANQAYVPNPSPLLADGRLGYADTRTVNILSKGVIWVWSAVAISLGDAVRFYKVDHSGTIATAFLGRWGKAAVSTKTIAITSGARWLSESSAAGLVLLEFDLPSATFSADA